jgi:short-subunit dehydrogenase
MTYGHSNQRCSVLFPPLPKGDERRKKQSALWGEVAVVTGAAGGIGSALCHTLAVAGCRLGLVSRTSAKLDALVEELRPTEAPLSAHAVDVGDRAALTAALAAIESELGPVDLLIHNAGVARVTQATAPNLDDFEEMLRVNYLGGVYAVAAVLPGMIARGHGRIVTISSLGARRGMAWSAGYSASKAAISTYLESLRPALRRRGINVTTVFLGFVDTPMTAALPLGLPLLMMRPQTAAKHILRAILRGRREVSAPWHEASGSGMLRLLPPWAFDLFMSNIGRLVIKGDY